MISLDNLLSAVSDAGQPGIANILDSDLNPYDVQYAEKLANEERADTVERLNRIARESNQRPHEVQIYPDGPVLEAFFRDRSWYSTIFGSFGSGKTVVTIAKILALMSEVPVSRGTESKRAPLGIRNSKLLVVRNTFAQLERTTIPDWQVIFPDYLGVMKGGNKIVQDVRFALPDGTHVKCFVEFVALDRLQDLSKITGAQLTFAWCNEQREIVQELVDTLLGRTGRFPNKADVGRYFSGLLGDYNAPSEDSELCVLRETKTPRPDHFWRVEGTFENGGSVVYWKAKPRDDDPDYPANFPESPDSADYAMFRQPGGLMLNEDSTGFVPNPQAENLSNLTGGYYTRMAERSFPWVYVNGANLYGTVTHGRPVHPGYNSLIHRADVPFNKTWISQKCIYGGFDAGRTPSMVLAAHVNGGLRYFYERQGSGSADVFARDVKTDIWEQFGIEPTDIEWISCEPRSVDGGQATSDTPLLMLQSQGFKAIPSPCNNDPQIRRAALDGPLGALADDGQPMVVFSTTMVITNKGLSGSFKYKLIQTPGGDARYGAQPDKDETSHCVEAAEYLAVGIGYGFQFMLAQKVDKNARGKRVRAKNSGITHYRDIL